MRRSHLFALAGVLILAILWIALDWGAQGENPRLTDDSALAGSMEASLAEPADLLEANASDAEGSDAATRTTAADGATPARMLTVRVVKESGGPSISGVRVRMVDSRAPENAALAALLWDPYRDRETAAQNFGVVSMTDAEGRVRFPRPETGNLYARAGAYFAHEVIYWQTPEELELKLELDLEVRALVLDADDHPVAGAPVAWMNWQGDMARIQLKARSGADGIARIPHLQSRFPLDPARRDVLLLSMPGGVEGQVSFSPAAPPAEPILLRMPAYGSVEVLVLDADSQPFPDGTMVMLQAALSEPEKAQYWDYKPSLHDEKGRADSWTLAGAARFDHVGVGQRLEALAYHRDLRSYFGVEVDGLSAPGEPRRVVLQLGLAPSVLTGRLLGADGAPIRGASIAARLCYDGGSLGRAVTTDAEGSFRHVHDEQKFPSDSSRVWWLAHADPVQGGILVGRVPLTKPLSPGDNELGEIRLGAGGLIAAGSVVDQNGIPLPGVRLGLAPGGGSGSEHVDLPRGADRRSHLTNEQGRFAFFGADAGRSWMLSFELEGWHRQSREVVAGSEELRIQLERNDRRVIGRLLLDEDLPRDLLRVVWQKEERTHAAQTPLQLAADGSLSCDSTISGTGGVYLYSHRRDEVLASVPNLTLAADTGLLPGLDPLDLRGRLFYQEVLVTGPGAQTPGKLTLAFGAQPSRMDSHWSNPLRCLTTNSDYEITIYAPNAAAKQVRLSGGATEVRVEQGRPVQWELIGNEWRELGLKIGLSPYLNGVLDGYGCELDASGKGSGFLPGAGSYQLYLQYSIEIDGKLRRADAYTDACALDGAKVFEVDAGTTPVLIQFKLKDDAAAASRAYWERFSDD